MKITVSVGGGFAGGHSVIGPVDTASLSSSLAIELTDRVARILTLGAARPEPLGADFITYELTTTRPGANPKTVKVVDEGDPNDPLLAEMLQVTSILQMHS